MNAAEIAYLQQRIEWLEKRLDLASNLLARCNTAMAHCSSGPGEHRAIRAAVRAFFEDRRKPE